MICIQRHCACICALLGLAAVTAAAQTVTAISPSTISAGSKNFILTVTGTNFDKSAVVELNGQTHETVPVSNTQLKALVYSADVASPATILVTVVNSNGSESDAVHLTVTGKSGTPPPPPPPSGAVTVTIKSPSSNQTVCSPFSLSASATTSSSGAEIIRWMVIDQGGTQLYSLNGVDPSIDPKISAAAGNYVLTVMAYNSAGVTGTAKVNVSVTAATSVCGTTTPPPSGPISSFHGCLFNQVGLTHQAIDFTVNKATTLPFNATLYYGTGCDPHAWADQFGFGQQISFTASTYTFWFSDFPDQPDTSAIWTVGNQSSGCVNYTSAPAC